MVLRLTVMTKAMTVEDALLKVLFPDCDHFKAYRSTPTGERIRCEGMFGACTIAAKHEAAKVLMEALATLLPPEPDPLVDAPLKPPRKRRRKVTK
jgi:hypothetical protein